MVEVKFTLEVDYGEFVEGNVHVVEGSSEGGHFSLELCISSSFALMEGAFQVDNTFLLEDRFRGDVPSSGHEATVFHVWDRKPRTDGGNYLWKLDNALFLRHMGSRYMFF